MKKVTLIGILLLLGAKAYNQTNTWLTIDSCYSLAKKNYPMIKQMALIEKTKEYSIANAAKGYLPQLHFAGQATYQSEVTQLPISLPGVAIQQLSKDQYRIYGEISQSLTDPILIKQQKEFIRAHSAAEQEKLEVEFYKLKERINQVYFGVLLIDAQLEQSNLLKKDIETGIKKTNAAIANGTGLKSNADMLSAELLKVEQRTTELKATRKGFTDMLSLFINQSLTEKDMLQTPEIQTVSPSIHRPELKLFDVQKKSFDAQNKILLAKNLPKLSLFFQGGYGRPTLNVLNNEFGTYYIGGARFSWNVTGFYTYKKEKQMQEINQHVIDVQKEVFLFNTNMVLKQQNSELTKLSELMVSDSQIITLREKIKNTANAQLENGTITSLDYLHTLNAEDQAKQNLALHKIQFLLAQYTYQTTSGN